MKKIYFILAISIFISSFQLYAQDSTKVKAPNETILYTIGLNEVPDGCNVPLIGFVNKAKGNHSGLQLGFLNTNSANFKGLQVGFANTVGESNSGAQIGFFNTVNQSTQGLSVGFFNTNGDSANGLQTGFFNTLGNSFSGIQCGFFNTLGNSGKGLQVGFFNTLGNSFKGLEVGFFNTLGNSIEGTQVGFFNTVGNSAQGLQVGFVNTVGNKTEGAQIGFINTTRKLLAFQLGFINRVDTVVKGIPVGFLSFVKKGGYQAIEFGTSEMFPVNLSYKTGIKEFYTSIVLSYNPISQNHYGIGMGIGSIIPINEKLNFNPEFISQTTCTVLWDQIYNLHLNLNYKLSDHFSLSGGPTVVWNHLQNGSTLHKPVIYIYKNEINTRNNLLVGLNVALNYQF